MLSPCNAKLSQAKALALLATGWLRDQRESQWSLSIEIFCLVLTGPSLNIYQTSQSRSR